MLRRTHKSIPSKRFLTLVSFAVFFSIVVFSFLYVQVSPTGFLGTYDLEKFDLLYFTPIILWVGLIGLGLLFVYVNVSNVFSKRISTLLMFTMFLVIASVFFGLPYGVETYPRYQDSWAHGGNAKKILESGHLDPENNGYQTYPSSFILLAAVSEVTTIDVMQLLRFSPIALALCFFLALIVFMKRVLHDERVAILAAFVYGLSTYYLAFHFSPEIFGWILFFSLLLMLSKIIETRNCSRESLFTIIVLLFAVCTTHPVTQFIVLVVLSALTILMTGRIRGHVRRLLIFSVVLFASWATTNSWIYFVTILQGFRGAFSKILSDLTSSIMARPFYGESTPEAIRPLQQFRQALYALTPATAAIGYFLVRKSKDFDLKLLISLVLSGILIGTFTVFGVLPLERPIKLAFIPLSALSGYLLLKRRKVGTMLLIFLILTVPINFASYYWGESRAMTHGWEVSAATYISSGYGGIVMGEFKETLIMRYYGNFTRVYNDYYLVGHRPDIFNASFIERNEIDVIYLTQFTILREQQAGRYMSFETYFNTTVFNSVYSDGHSLVLFRNR